MKKNGVKDLEIRRDGRGKDKINGAVFVYLPTHSRYRKMARNHLSV